MSKVIQALIADDEVALREHLQRLLHKLWPELKVCALAENGQQALDNIAQYQPDIAFLDIRMPGISGMDVAKHIADTTHIVFVTAYDQYAVDAFSQHAIDYLLKPVSESRLAETIVRLKEKVTTPQAKTDVLEKLFQQLEQQTTEPKAYMQWLRVMTQDAVHLMHVDDVAYFKFENKYTSVRDKNKTHLIRTPLKELEASLNPEKFWRIHRNTIVNVNWIQSAEESDSGLRLKLKHISDELSVSRANRHLFKQM